VQGWNCFTPKFKAVDFVSFYIELPVMAVMFVGWKLFKRTKWVKLEEMDLVSDRYDTGLTSDERAQALDDAKLTDWKKGQGWKQRMFSIGQWLFV
jgi:AAT family amino acid transporter